MSQFDVHAVWDAEAGVWTAYSDDIPGLVTEAATWDEMVKRAAAAAAELIVLNSVPHDKDVQLRFVAQQTAPVAA